MGISLNGLIQHTMNLLFVEHFQVIPQDYPQLFLLITSHHDVLKKEIYLEQKIRTQIFNCKPAGQARQKFLTSSY